MGFGLKGSISRNIRSFCIRFNVKSNIKLTCVTSKNGEEVPKSVTVRFLYDTSRIQCDKYKGNMELINISSKCIVLVECKRLKKLKAEDISIWIAGKNLKTTKTTTGKLKT